MAFWNKSKVKQYNRDPKTGKLVKTSQTTVSGKGADVSRALEANGQNIKPSKLGNQRELQRQQHTQNMARIAGRTSNIANAVTQLGLTTQKAIGSLKPIETNTVNTKTVDQLVNGGAEIASNTRDDENTDDDSEWVA